MLLDSVPGSAFLGRGRPEAYLNGTLEDGYLPRGALPGACPDGKPALAGEERAV
jgi:hypothetical protein